MPLTYLHSQTSHVVEQHPHLLADSLADPALALVEFNPRAPGIKDEHFLENTTCRAALDEMHAMLLQDFRSVSEPESYWRFWIRCE